MSIEEILKVISETYGVNNEKLVEILKTSYGLHEILDLLKMPRKLELRLKEYVRKLK